MRVYLVCVLACVLVFPLLSHNLPVQQSSRKADRQGSTFFSPDPVVPGSGCASPEQGQEAAGYAFHDFPAPLPVQNIGLEQLNERVMGKQNDTLYVVNFWATWCKPCVKELPYFEEVGTEFAEQPVVVLLLSLDMPSDRDEVDRFIAEKGLKSEVYLFRAGDPNIWIDRIDSKWSGAIPATVFYRSGEKKIFREGVLSREELYTTINSLLGKG